MGESDSDISVKTEAPSAERINITDDESENITDDELKSTYHCNDCGGLGIPIITVRRHKIMCDTCHGLGVVGLQHLAHDKCIDILEAQKKYLGDQASVGDGSKRRVGDEIRREKKRKEKLAENFRATSVKIIGNVGTTNILKDLQGEVTRCHNAQNQQYEVEIKDPTAKDIVNLKTFYKSESTKYDEKDGTHYVYVQRQELENVTRRRLTPDTRRRLPEDYDTLRPAEQALARRRLMNPQTSHIVVLERLLEEINELNY